MWNYVPINKLIGEKAKEQEHNRHLIGVYTAKKSIQNTSPFCPSSLTQKHIHIPPLIRATKLKIHNDNQNLINKMIAIESVLGKLHPRNMKKTYVPASKTFNTVTRKQFLQKVNNENKEIVKRLSSVKSTYRIQTWEEQGKFQNAIKRRLSNQQSQKLVAYPDFLNQKLSESKLESKERSRQQTSHGFYAQDGLDVYARDENQANQLSYQEQKSQ